MILKRNRVQVNSKDLNIKFILNNLMIDRRESIMFGLGLIQVIIGGIGMGFLIAGYVNEHEKEILKYLRPQTAIQETYDPTTSPEIQEWVREARRLAYR